MREWDYPVSHESMVLMDFFDLFFRANSKKKAKPYPRPFKNDNVETTRSGKAESKLTAVDKLNKMKNGKTVPVSKEKK
jgi:hypothetical protein